MSCEISRVQRARPCWPLFRKKCEACGRKFRWQRGVKWHPFMELAKWAISVGNTKKPTLYLCANCRPSSSVITAGGVERWVDYLKRTRPLNLPNCRCITLPRSRMGSITTEEAKRAMTRASKMGMRVEDIHIPRRNKKEPA